MENTFNESLRNIYTWSTPTAILSFVFGTIMFLLFKTGEQTYAALVFGFLYVCGAFAVNGMMLVGLVALLFKAPEYRQIIVIKIMILSLNIPIVFLYLQLL